ncbi:MAG: hypothetical protein DCC55_29950 [Chloroflexi bacterium]|jgi:hypothetical protein|nr:MAG: hypothetical protein DCC55_29950 [Chloroflexota bacterium]
MQYIVEPIGAQFSNNDLTALAKRFNARASEGYRFHSVFQVSQPGCLGLGQPTITYLAVYEKQETQKTK